MVTNTSYRTLEEVPLMLDVPAVAKILGVGKNMAYALVNSGEIKGLRIGCKIRVPKQNLVDYITKE